LTQFPNSPSYMTLSHHEMSSYRMPVILKVFTLGYLTHVEHVSKWDRLIQEFVIFKSNGLNLTWIRIAQSLVKIKNKIIIGLFGLVAVKYYGSCLKKGKTIRYGFEICRPDQTWKPYINKFIYFLKWIFFFLKTVHQL
jgi:hypothetical protein